MDEIWKDVVGYEGLYQVSDLGRVRSLDRKTRIKHKARIFKGAILKPILKKSTGYYVVSLHNNGKQKQQHVHRLVAESFCERKAGQDVVDHINTNTTDNRAENLRWTTTKGNVNNPISAKRRTDAVRKACQGMFGANHPVSKAVLQLTMSGKLIKRWACASDAVRELGADSGSITRCCKGKVHSHKGFKWQYDL